MLLVATGYNGFKAISNNWSLEKLKEKNRHSPKISQISQKYHSKNVFLILVFN